MNLGEGGCVTTFKMVIRNTLNFRKLSLGHISFLSAEQFTASSTNITRRFAFWFSAVSDSIGHKRAIPNLASQQLFLAG